MNNCDIEDDALNTDPSTEQTSTDYDKELFEFQIEKEAISAYSKKKKHSYNYDKKGDDSLSNWTFTKFRLQIIKFRAFLFYFLLALMLMETITLFTIIILSSLDKLEIEPLTLQILTGATIAQISAMIIVIIQSVFSDTLNQFVMLPPSLPLQQINDQNKHTIGETVIDK
jgi:hypothetical protein